MSKPIPFSGCSSSVIQIAIPPPCSVILSAAPSPCSVIPSAAPPPPPLIPSAALPPSHTFSYSQRGASSFSYSQRGASLDSQRGVLLVFPALAIIITYAPTSTGGAS